MVDKVIALLEALRAEDLDAARPVDLERLAALCRHWADLTEKRNEVIKPGILSNLKQEPRDE
jgi:hypothetical protein